MMFPAVEYFTEGSDTVAFAVVKQGDLIPAEEESYNHTARACTIGPDNRIYITLGQPFNVTPPEKLDMYREVGIGGIVSFNRDGGDRKVVLTGLRNSSGLAFNPKDGALWWTDNQVDGMGDETPPGELNKVPVGADGKLTHGLWYGHPFYGGGDVRTDDYKDKPIPKELADNYVKPQVEMVAHAADLGMMFYTGDQFPAKYKNAIFSAQHGSWNAVKPRGARIMVTYLDSNGNAAKTEPFAEGFMTSVRLLPGPSGGRAAVRRRLHPGVRRQSRCGLSHQLPEVSSKLARAGWASRPVRLFCFYFDCFSMKSIFLAAALTLVATQSAWAGDPEAGKVKAAQCAVCHGMNGLSVLAEAPNLAGQPEDVPCSTTD
jgi:hypothetical protein